ncbi:MAG: acetyl-CoA carboxylase biotin carboxyl carrier protein [Porticoccaceae bacterium]
MKGTVSQEEIEKLIEQFQEGDAQELHVRFEGFEIYLSQDANGGISIEQNRLASSPAGQGRVNKSDSTDRVSSTAAAGEIEEDEVNTVQVKAPYMGTFYRAPKPGAEPYVQIGQTVMAETEVCLVEVMKLFTAVRAGASGKIKKVLVEDGAMVRAGQPLFVIAAE